MTCIVPKWKARLLPTFLLEHLPFPKAIRPPVPTHEAYERYDRTFYPENSSSVKEDVQKDEDGDEGWDHTPVESRDKWDCMLLREKFDKALKEQLSSEEVDDATAKNILRLRNVLNGTMYFDPGSLSQAAHFV